MVKYMVVFAGGNELLDVRDVIPPREKTDRGLSAAMCSDWFEIKPLPVLLHLEWLEYFGAILELPACNKDNSTFVIY
jgi:hypothetical protein